MKRKIGFVGLGKLGLPVAVCLGQKFSVVGWDVDPERMATPIKIDGEQGDWGGREMADLIETADLKFAPPSEMGDCDVVFLAVQTPHRPELDGTTPLSHSPEDFDYTHLKKAAADLAPRLRKEQVLVVISTCLPGTTRREILPIVGGRCSLVYNPFFIAMGTVVKDFLNPEFVLLGSDDSNAVKRVVTLYRDFYMANTPSIASMSIESAELTKVAYNCYLSQKIVLANYLGEMCHKVPGCDVDDVTGALKLATDRIVSRRYMDAGVGDGGGCLTADTMIPLLNGKEVPVKDLVEVPEFYVYSYDLMTHQVVPGRAHSCRKTKSEAAIYEVELDNGSTIRCTADHPYLLRDGTYVEVKDLEPGQRLMPFYRQISLSWGFVERRIREGMNHKIAAVRFVGREDVYNFEVDVHENYAVSAGVFIHNCHPRDNIAMSWLANRLNLSYDPCAAVTDAREAQTEWHADLIERHRGDLPVVVLGKSYKPNVVLTAGSPALLLANVLRERDVEFTQWDPYVDASNLAGWTRREVALYFVATKHDCFNRFEFPKGSVVIDPFRYLSDREGVVLIRIGKGAPVA